MASFYNTFRQQQWELSPLGLEDRGPEGGYFCTPVGAQCIGWPGVDGIHFCFIRGHRETVFAVSPMNTPGTCVHPIARTFRDFLRLLLSYSTAALEQLWQWDRSQFNEFAAQDAPSQAGQELLKQLAEAYRLRPMSNPYGYVKALQQDFTESSLHFPPEYIELCREAEQNRPWTVFFSGAEYGAENEEPGRELPLNQNFSWEGQPWQLLSLYLCGDGLVGDFAVPVARSAIEAFFDKWLFLEEMGMTEAQQEQAQQESPFRMDVHIAAEINSQRLGNFHGQYKCWNLLAEDTAAARWLEHYGLDREQGWVFQRSFWPYSWQDRSLERLTLHLREDPAWISGPVFTARAGDRISFILPATGQQHTLIIEDGPEVQTIDLLQPPDLELPTHCQMITWRAEPELPRDVLTIRDRDGGDQPRSRAAGNGGAACIGIIGGADGPTAVILAAPGAEKKQAAVSGLYFTPPEQIHWQLRFRESRRPELTLPVKLPMEVCI